MENDGRQLIYVQNGSPKMDGMFIDFSHKIHYTWQVVGVGAGYIGKRIQPQVVRLRLRASSPAPPRLRLVA